MLRSTTFDTYIANCTTVEQILDLAARCLYNRYFASSFIITGLDEDGSAIHSPKISHWAGTQLIAETQNQEQTITSFTTQVSIAHKQSTTPWLEVLPLGDAADTPNGQFA